MTKKILIIGGAGYIGSHVNKMLSEEGYETIIFDNLSRGSRDVVVSGAFVQGDTANSEDLDHVLATYRPDAVMHFAAYTDVGESVNNPTAYYQNNVNNTIHILNAMLRHNIKNIIFSSSAAVYGTPQQEKLTEDHPTYPINPYGWSKLMVERILNDYYHAHGIQSCCLRYFNAAGGDPAGIIKFAKTEGLNLIPIVLLSLKNKDAKVPIFGTDYSTHDGTCVRDYIHVYDLASAHIQAMKKLWEGTIQCHQYNLGNGQGFTVKEVVDTISAITKIPVNAYNAPRRAGDPPVLIANADKALKELDWKPQFTDLSEMIEHAWAAIR